MNKQTTILLASDHAGFQMKTKLKQHLDSKGINVVDLGTHSEGTVDYPDYGHLLGKSITEGAYDMGISICGSGNGINMTTNKHKGVRGALCWNEEIAELARKHNNANVCSLPGRFISQEMAEKIVDIFLSTGFEGGRHDQRIRKIDL
jgi:ribose 5-phosphate isomerase B